MSDPCREQPTFSAYRFFLFLPFFLIIIPGSIVFFILLADRPYGVQLASMIVYTAAVFLYTFCGNRGLWRTDRPVSRYLFNCPAVHRQLNRLVVRHLGFLTALFIIETTALQLRPRMPASWFAARGRNISLFTTILLILCGSLLLTQVITNRSVLARAHLENNAD